MNCDLPNPGRAGRGVELSLTDLPPARAAVRRLEDAAPVVAVGREVLLAGAHIDVLGIERIDRDRCNGGRTLRVRQGRPASAAIGGFPHATVRGTDIDDVGVTWIDRDAADRSGRGGSDSNRSRANRRPRVLGGLSRARRRLGRPEQTEFLLVILACPA